LNTRTHNPAPPPQLLADQQVSLQRKIEESDFENAQDMFGGGGGANGAAADSGRTSYKSNISISVWWYHV